MKFEDAAQQKAPSLVRELFDWLRHNKKWWIAPILVVVLLLGAFLLVTATPLGPWIYALI